MLMPATFADPYRQRRAPVTVAPQGPIHVVFQPVAKAAFLNVLRYPVDLLVQFHHAFFDLAGADKPGGARHVQQRRVAAPAEGIGVRDRAAVEQQASLLEVFHD